MTPASLLSVFMAASSRSCSRSAANSACRWTISATNKSTRETVDFARYQVVLLQHVRGEDRDHYQRLIAAAKQRRPDLRVLSISGLAERSLPDSSKRHWIEYDPRLGAYYGSVKENARRMLIYINVTYLHAAGTVLPPLSAEHRRTIYHPDCGESGLLATIDDFLQWSRKRGWDVAKAPRAVVTVHSSHLAFQQPKVVDALVRALEKKGVLTVAIFDLAEDYLHGDYETANAGVPPAGGRPHLSQHRFPGLSRATGRAAPALDFFPHPVDRRLAREPARAGAQRGGFPHYRAGIAGRHRAANRLRDPARRRQRRSVHADPRTHRRTLRPAPRHGPGWPSFATGKRRWPSSITIATWASPN